MASSLRAGEVAVLEKIAPVAARRGAVDAHKPAVEVPLVGVAAGGRNVGERHPTSDQALRLRHPARLLVAMRGEAVGGRKRAQQPGRRQGGEATKLAKAQRLAALRVDALSHALEPRGCRGTGLLEIQQRLQRRGELLFDAELRS